MLLGAGRGALAQMPVIIRGGWVFTSTGDQVVRNRGILVRGGIFQVVNGDITLADTRGARTIALSDSDYVLPGLIDVHAHYNMTLGPNGIRSDEYTYNPLIFLANGVTATFPAGEYDPEGMMEARKRIDSGQQIGPRIFNSGPYFGTARRGWNQNATAEDIYKDVDKWAALGARGFKAKRASARRISGRWSSGHTCTACRSRAISTPATGTRRTRAMRSSWASTASSTSSAVTCSTR